MQPAEDVQLCVHPSGQRTNAGPEAKSQGGELEQQTKPRDDLLCYITAIVSHGNPPHPQPRWLPLPLQSEITGLRVTQAWQAPSPSYRVIRRSGSSTHTSPPPPMSQLQPPSHTVGSMQLNKHADPSSCVGRWGVFTCYNNVWHICWHTHLTNANALQNMQRLGKTPIKSCCLQSFKRKVRQQMDAPKHLLHFITLLIEGGKFHKTPQNGQVKSVLWCVSFKAAVGDVMFPQWCFCRDSMGGYKPNLWENS